MPRSRTHVTEPANTSPDNTANQSPASDPADDATNDPSSDQVIVLSGNAMAVAGEDAVNPAELVERPDKVMRIGNMVKQLLDEVRSAPLDERGRERLAQIHQQSLKELEDGLAPELVEELQRMNLPFDPEDTPSDAELRIAQAQLVGWLEGLFHGIQAAVFAQQAAAQSQLRQMRQLPGASGDSGGGPTGQYL